MAGKGKPRKHDCYDHMVEVIERPTPLSQECYGFKCEVCDTFLGWG